MKEWKPTDVHYNIMDYIRNSECPVVFAKEVGEYFGITSQKASGALRALENHGYLEGKLLGGGLDKVKVYYFAKE